MYQLQLATVISDTRRQEMIDARHATARGGRARRAIARVLINTGLRMLQTEARWDAHPYPGG